MIKKILSTVLIVCMLAAATATFSSALSLPAFPFTDVKTDDWYYDAVKYSFENGMMNGASDSTFEGMAAMSRAMFATILCRMAGGEETLTDEFKDVPDGKWYSGYIGWAYKNELVDGYPDGTFLPEKPISRQEMTTLMSRFVGFVGIIPTRARNAIKTFADADKIGDWAADAVNEMRISGMIEGNEDGTFRPESFLNRAEAATIVMRFNEMLKETSLEDPTVLDYKVEGKDFYLLGAWDVFYSGSALTTGYGGTKVDESGDIPTLVKDDEGRKISHFYLNPENTTAKGNYYGFDLKILGINPTEYPIVKIGYNSESTATAAVYSGGDKSGSVSVTTKDEAALIDLTDCGKWDESSEQIVLTLMAEKDISVTYFAAFKNSADAESFNTNDYSEKLKISDPIDINYSTIDADVLAKYKSDIEKSKNDIINSANTVDPREAAKTGTVYYISSKNGSDDNDGLSSETAWKTTKNLYKQKLGHWFTNLEKGDTVLFERGSVFFADRKTNNSGYYALDIYPGITYSSYGTGNKPMFTNACDFGESQTGTWTKTSVKNVYELDYDLTVPEGCGLTSFDIGNIVFDGGKAWGIKVCVNQSASLENPGDYTTVASGWVTNGIDCYEEGGVKFEGLSTLKNNLEFWHDHKAGKLYLRCEQGNPAEVFNEIKVSKHGAVIRGGGEDIILDNVAIKYTGSHGIQTSEVVNLSVTNCEIGWCGGSFSHSDDDRSRYGNGYENWDTCDGLYVENNYVYQCYDTGITTQGAGVMKNISFANNILEYCNTGYELWTGNNDPDQYIANCRVADSYQTFAGYGFGVQRPLGNKNGASSLGQKIKVANYYNYVYENNVNLWCSYFGSGDGNYARGPKTEGAITKNNVYLMSSERGYIIRSRNNLIDLNGSHKTLYPYTKQYIGYVTSLGIESGSTFYYYDGYLNEGNVKGEELGVYYE